MGLELYEAILHTGSRTKESLLEEAKREKWIGSTTEKDLENIIESGKYFDGVKAAVAVDFSDENKYILGFWCESDDEKVKNAIYLMEQDDLFGCYVNDREGFEKTWASGDYEPAGSISFSKEEVEILGPLGKEWRK